MVIGTKRENRTPAAPYAMSESESSYILKLRTEAASSEPSHVFAESTAVRIASKNRGSWPYSAKQNTRDRQNRWRFVLNMY